MRLRWLTLVVMVYVALDLANPMMPGAMQLVGSSVETVDGCQPRSDDARGPALPAIPRHLERVAREAKRALRDRVRTDPEFPRHATIFRPSIGPDATLPSPSDDD